MDCSSALAVCGEDSTDMSFLYYHGSVRRAVSMSGDIGVGTVTRGNATMR